MRTTLFLATLGLALFDMGSLKAFALQPEAYIFGSLLFASIGLLYAIAKPLFPKA
jgi:hypothetical protein